jgi:cation diffusion facilitator CzcD-associated flavoprotein CzcO
MIAARIATRDLTLRMQKRAEAASLRRARQIERKTSSADWRSAASLWPEFGMD